MKVLHFITSLKIGGAESALVNFLTYEQRYKDNPLQHTVLHLYHGPNVEKIENLGISTHQITGFFHRYDPFSFLRLIRFIKKIKPDVIHTSLWSANIMGRLAGAMLGIPVISDLHGSALDEGSLRNNLDALTAPCASKIIAVSPSVKASYLAGVIPKVISTKRQQATYSRIEVIHNGIDIEQVQAIAQENPLKRSDFSWNDDDFVIGAVGRLEPIKSYDILIKAFAYLLSKKNLRRSPKLCLIGDGSEMEKLQNLARELGASSSIYFAGMRNNAIAFYPLFDCFALSSQSEGLSISLLEALCFGLPIVSTHLNLHHDVITHETNGLLVSIGDKHSLADALNILLADPDKANAMRKANAQLIQSFDLAHTAKKYTEIYQDLCRFYKEKNT